MTASMPSQLIATDPANDARAAAEDRGQVLVIEDHAGIVAGLRSALQSQGERARDYDLVVASAVQEGIDALNSCVQLVLVDLRTTEPAERDPLQALYRMRRAAPRVPIGIFGADESETLMARAMASGAIGFIHKHTPVKVQLAAIDLMRHGGVYLSPSFIANLNTVGAAPSRLKSPFSALSEAHLTARQRSVLELVLKGESNKDIAEQLGLGVGTVKNYVSGLLKLAHATTRGRLQALGSVDSDDPPVN